MYYLAWMVQPRNYLLFACHLTNATAQSVQEVRFVKYWHMGGRDKKLAALPVDHEAPPADGKVTEAVKAAIEAKKA